MSYLAIFFLLLVSGIALAVWMAKSDFDELIGIPIFMITIGLIGSIVASVEENRSERWEPIQVEVTKNTRLVMVDDGEKTWEFKDYKTYMEINDSCKFYRQHTTNFWGYEMKEDIKWDCNCDSTKTK